MFKFNGKDYSDKEIVDNFKFLTFISTENESYQALYASQDLGCFYVVYGKFSFFDNSRKIRQIEFKMMNYKKPFIKGIGFPATGMKKSYVDTNYKERKLKIQLPINRIWKRSEKMVITFSKEENIDLTCFDFVVFKKFYVKNNRVLADSRPFKFPTLLPTKAEEGIMAFHHNCEESIIGITP